ncbi:MAG: amino acid permease [Imperialibacter sp.]|uniref:amino acid permease n=1 Tax=Imperialibacter sp. TaxID=2038411 RepID=UPI0032EAD742
MSQEKKIGLWTSTSLVVGNMIGSGIFFLPVALAAYGAISLLGWVISSIGALFLALVFVRLSRRFPNEDGGPYTYATKGLGHFAGFLSSWGYQISTLATNAAIVVAFVSYLSVLIPQLAENSGYPLAVSLAVVWLLTWINTLGIKEAGYVQLTTTVLKLAPLLLITIAGLFYVDFGNFRPFNISEVSNFSAVTATATITLFAFMGLEVATIPGKSIRNPETTVPKATMLGTLITTGVYILSSVALMGMIHPSELQHSNAPFADAAGLIWGDTGRYLITIGALISTFGALNGWILLQGQTPYAAAKNGDFPRIFAKVNKNGAPAVGLIIGSVIVSVLLVMNYSRGMAGAFEFLILLTATTVLVPYLFSAASFLIVNRNQNIPPAKRLWDICLGLLAFGYGMWAMIGAGQESIAWGFVSLLLGIPLYVFGKTKPNRLTSKQ